MTFRAAVIRTLFTSGCIIVGGAILALLLLGAAELGDLMYAHASARFAVALAVLAGITVIVSAYYGASE